MTELVYKLDTGDQWVYIQIARGTAMRIHAFPKEISKPNLWIMLKPASVQDINKKIRCITVDDKRFDYCHIKTLNYIPNILAAQLASDANVDDCIMHKDNIVTECAHANLCILVNETVITHPADEHIYAGIGRVQMINMCETLGIPVEERCFTLDEMFSADEIFRISGSSFCMQIVEIDGKAVGGKDYQKLKLLQNSLLDKFIKETN